MDMMGQSVYEYSHPCDHDELTECLSSKAAEGNDKRVCSFFLRLKCTLTSKGRKVNLKSASYKVGRFPIGLAAAARGGRPAEKAPVIDYATLCRSR